MFRQSEDITKTFLEDFMLKKAYNAIYSRLLRCRKARGSGTKFSLVGLTKVKAQMSFLGMRRSFVKLLGLIKFVTKMATKLPLYMIGL